MSFKDFINFTLISSKNFTITVYNLFIALAIIIATLFIVRFIRRIFKRQIQKNRLDRGSGWSIFLIINYFIWVIIIMINLDNFWVKISILIASIAALLVGVGLGIQQLFSDLASGIIIIIERNIQFGDIIELEDHTIGQVVEIGIRTTKIKSRDDIVMIVPNSKFVNDAIINWSHMDKKTRFNINVGVAYGSDVDLVKKILLQCAKEVKDVHSNPSPFVRFKDFGESSLDFQLFFWISETLLSENIKSDLRFLINSRFNENKIQIPFPQRDVHIIPKP